MSDLTNTANAQPRAATARSGAVALRVLPSLLALTAAANAAVDMFALALHVSGDLPEESAGVAVRTVWALLRSLGFLILIWHLRAGRVGAWPLAIVLTVTTIFGAARLAPWSSGGTPAATALIVGFVVTAVLCVAILVLFRTPAVRAHLTRRPPKWNNPSWVVTARVLALSFTALLLVPCLVAFGTLFGDQPLAKAPVVVGWLVFALTVNWILPPVVLFVRRGHRWARATLVALTVIVLVVQPLLCGFLLGVDGLIRDAIPLVIAAALVLYGLLGDRNARAFFAR